ncbi:MAG: response regulator [Sandaracinaceae bacterium]
MDEVTKRILVVEDNILIAMDVEDLIAEQGCTPVGPVATVADGLEAVRNTDLDGAVLDVNLGDERVWPIAELLAQHGVPFVLTTGYSDAEIPDNFMSRPRLEKPVDAGRLAAALADLGIIDR